MVEARAARGLLDTSVLIDLDRLPVEALPVRSAVSTLSLAELAAGLHTATTEEERSHRRARLERIVRDAVTLPFDSSSARAYGEVFAAVLASGRKARGRRAVDLMIAATARAADLPLFTRNPDDFKELGTLIQVVSVPEPSAAPAENEDTRGTSPSN